MTLRKRMRQQPSESAKRTQKRRHLLETLETRQLLAGPQLIGVQPNEGALIDDGAVRSVAPRALTFRFDETQQIDPATFEGIQIRRSGPDGQFGTDDDVRIVPGLVTLGDIRQNEVVVRFAENLPDDHYRIDVFAFDDPISGVTALRNIGGELFVPSTAGSRTETINFRLSLGALVEAVVPQPVVRLANGSLEQRRDEVMVYFNEDPLFVENDPATGLPTERSAENPRFYQLLLTQETVRTTDDVLYSPERVIYDASTHTARLIFATDINELPGVPLGGGTFRLRIGTAIDSRSDLILTPATLGAPASVGDTITTGFDLNLGSAGVQFVTDGSQTSSVIVPGSIDPKPWAVQLPGGSSDPGRLSLPEIAGGGLLQAINEQFGPDSTLGITEIAYNFQSSYAASAAGGAFLNQITDRQRTRVREALSLWSEYIGVQFRETTDQGITFAVGDPSALPSLGLQTSTPAVRSALNASLRIDPTYVDSAIVFSNETQFNTAFGEDFFRKAMAGIGFLIGLEQSTEFTAQSLMSLNPTFLNQTINPTNSDGTVNLGQLRNLEPSFPSNLDILHGQHIHRPDGIDVDLYRFVVDLGQGERTGTFTAEVFSERLADSSLLDSSLRLFQETRASVTTDLGLGTTLSVRLTAVQPGALGNNARIDFVRTQSGGIVIQQKFDAFGSPIPNAIEIQVPRTGTVAVGDLIAAINAHPFASTLFTAELVVGTAGRNIAGASLDRPLLLAGGALTELARNDDYFSNDSFLTASLANGIYYIGVAASGNDLYDPQLTASGSGGKSQGAYELALKFEPQVGLVDTIRDLDSTREAVPGTALDGDGDGVPGGVKNFWFQTRPLERLLEVNVTGEAIVPGQTFTIVGFNNSSRRFEFVPTGGSAVPGNIPIAYNPGDTGVATQASGLAIAIRSAIASVGTALGVTVSIPDATRPVVELVGERSIRFSNGFRGVEAYGRTVFVDKVAGVAADGSLARPFNNIGNPAVPNALGAVSPNDIVRIVGNGGQDANPTTPADNFAYKIGTAETGGGTLEDGRNLLVPKNVTVMIDAGAAIKLRNSAIVVGSTGLLADRSGGALQVLGTPRLVNITDPVLNGVTVVDTGVDLIGTLGANTGNVILTSTRDRGVDAAASGNSPVASEGNWGGIIFRRDLDQSQGRFDLEDEGIFLQTVNHADIRFGGGSNILIESVQQTVNPIQMINLRPNVTFNTLTRNAGAAMSASPDSFEETSYQSPSFQQAGPFTADYGRVGPDIKNNILRGNSINGLFVRAETGPTTPLRQLTVAGRFDDTDIVHYIAENIVIAGNPGGSIQDGVRPELDDVAGLQIEGGGVLTAGFYEYQMTFVDRYGFESLAAISPTARMRVGNDAAIELFNLPAVPAGGEYISRRLYRLAPGAVDFVLVSELDAAGTQFTDTGRRSGVALDLARQGVRGRLNASLVIDPGTIVKLSGARIELGQGTQLLAEGLPGLPVVFTSVADDRFGAGGSFDTNNDAASTGGGISPARGDWAGIYAGPTANISLSSAVIAFGGGVSLFEGGQSKAFSALELHQATGRVVDSRFEYNANGQGGAGPVGRNGRLGNTPSTIFARFTQPVLVGNEFVENRGPIIDIDSDSFVDDYVIDLGRQTGALSRLEELDDNHGPLIRRNTTRSTPSDSGAQRQLNGMYVRGGIISTSSVWDDTDIVHMVFDSIIVGNQVSGGELRLQSRPDESLVIKLAGGGNPNSPTAGTGFNVTGSQTNLEDRIGGTLHVIGLPGAPVVMTSLQDDTVGAGRQLDGSEQTDTNGDGFGSRPFPNDWRGVYMDEFTNDRNVAVIVEQELANEVAPGLNSTVGNAQFLGELAESFTASDERLRLGYEVHGFLSGANDIDTYSFSGAAGTPVWIDLDKTSIALNSVLEILDSEGNVLARSVNSMAEADDPSLIRVIGGTLAGKVGSLERFDGSYNERGEFGAYQDYRSTNPYDAGLSLLLPGPAGTRSVFYVRVRSASVNPADEAGGLTRGGYMMQVRLQEQQEFPGSTVQFADIRYANQGIHLQGLPGSSPLMGEVGEDEAVGPLFNNDTLLGGGILAARPQYVGNLASTKSGAISIAGELASINDIDFYRVDVQYGSSALSELRKSVVFDIDYADGFSRPDTNISIFYSPTGNPGAARLVLFGSGSNIAEDQSSPLGTEAGELLSRGSVAGGDPFVGPVAVPQGAYFVAVTQNGRLPLEFTTNPLVRREPIESVRRIFDDGIEAFGGRTADAPVNGPFIDTFSTGWEITTDRAADSGHQRSAGAFNQNSTGATTVASGGQQQGGGSFQNASGQPLVPGVDYVEDRLLMAFADGVSEARKQELLTQLGLTVLKDFSYVGSLLVGTRADDDLSTKITDLSGIPEILYAEPDLIGQWALTPNDPQYANMWAMENTGQTGGTPGADISAPAAWDVVTGSPQTVIAILDSGIDYTHPDLVDNMWVNPGEIPGNGIDDDGNGYIDDIFGINPGSGSSDPIDIFGHGTHVAGTVGAVGNNSIGVTGVNWNSKLMALSIGNAGPIASAAIEALNYLVNMKTNFGVNVVASNNSYGVGFSIAFQNAIQASNNAGVVFVAAAGNSRSNNDTFPAYPASYPLEGIISVASSDHNDLLSVFSNFGATSVDIAAPGTDILSTTLGGGYGVQSGTSMASPHVAGAVGLLAALQPSATVAELKNAILTGADPLASLAGTSVTGARLNVAQALANLASSTPFNQSIRFNRSVAQGVLSSSAFDLAGYSAADLPRLYFDYFLDAAPNDVITVRATSDQQTAPVNLAVNLNRNPLFGTWRQSISSLNAFAGHTGIVIEFVYNVDQTAAGFEGLYLDNFVVGFAERGESVSGAFAGSAGFTAATTPVGTAAVAGAYQLEMRPGTMYGTELDAGVLVQRFLSTSGDLLQSVWLQAPAGSAIIPYQTIDIEVENALTGVDELVSFQFVPTDEIASFVGSDTLYAVEYDPTDSADQVAAELISVIRSVTTHRFFSALQSDFELTDTFDTNDRHARQVTLVAPAGNQIVNGDRFTLNDGGNSVTFEFNTAGGFNPNVIRIPYLATDSPRQIAQRLINAINGSVVQAALKIKASPASSNTSLTTTDGRVNLTGIVNGNFTEVRTTRDVPAVLDFTTRAGGGRDIRMPAILHDGIGDSNVRRTQGQIIIDSSRVSDVRGIGIWSEPARRQTDPRDNLAGSFLVEPPVGLNHAGAVLNLPTLNDSVIGGLVPGVVIVNNIIDQAGYSAIKVDGQAQPVIVELGSFFDPEIAFNLNLINDGDTFQIDAAGTRVVFEFDDVGGGVVPAGGSGIVGGNGVADGRIPIYFHHRSATGLYNGVQNVTSTIQEVLVGMQQAINGSILVTNNLAGLVRAYVGPSVLRPVNVGGGILNNLQPPALYIEGISNFYFNFGGISSASFLPLAEAPQPFARIVNNTIYGNDGTESQFFGQATDESNDVLSQAVDTKLGRSHKGTYVTNGVIGDNTNALGAARDVDLFRVELGVGDRLVVDVDTLPVGPTTSLRVFDSNGIPQAFLTGGNVTSTVSRPGATPVHLNPGSTTATPATDALNARDGFIDFTATKKGTYYVGISSAGNDTYDPLSLSGRTVGTGGTGAYTLGMEVYAPRDFVLSVDGNQGLGTRAGTLVGTTFTITQIPDLPANSGLQAFGNRVTFEFTNNAGGAVLPNGNINVPLIVDQANVANGGYRVQEISRAMAAAINRVINGRAVLANHFGSNGPDGRNGPIPPVNAIALGGASGDNAAINKIGLGVIPGPTNDYQRLPGFGHNRREIPGSVVGNIGTVGGLSDGSGTSELYVLVQNAARIELSAEARNAGLRLTPDQATPAFATEADQLLAETGVMITQGASPSLVNNVFMNLHQSIVGDETAFAGFGVNAATNLFYKEQQIVVTGNVFQYDDPRNSRIRADVSSPNSPGGNPGITTDAFNGPSNINGGTSDFNVTLAGTVRTLENAAGDRMTPAPNSPIIDSAVNSIAERDRFAALKLSVGIPVSNILAPDRDNSGQLRADDPNVASSGGLGANVFKDRGALDRADFVGPVAIIESPRDNDATRVDSDPSETFLQLNSGIYDEFRILLRDVGDSSDPFVGSGIDDNTVVVPVLPGLREAGANVALFEGDRLLTEGVDYTFSYDSTRGLITLRPLAGIWRDDRAYRVSINNRDRLVGLAPSASAIGDGDSFLVVDENGGRVTFEFESGYELRVPETLQFTVPPAATGTGGITDGSRFSISGLTGNPIFFEFDRDNVTLPGSRVIRFATGDTPETIAVAARNAIQAAVTAGLLNVTPVLSGSTVIIGSEPGTILDASRTALLTSARTIALSIPAVVTGPGGIVDGDTFTINDGNRTVRFEFDDDGAFNPVNEVVDISGLTQLDAVRDAIFDAINASALTLRPFLVGNLIFLNLPVSGSAQVATGQLGTVGISRTPSDGSTITFTQPDGTPFTFVLDRTDVDSQLPTGDVVIPFTRELTGDQLAERIAAAIRGTTIDGLTTTAVFANPGGQVAIGGEAPVLDAPGLGLGLDATSSLEIVGAPGVSGSSLLTISGPLLLQLPIVGGSGIPDDSQFQLNDGNNVVTFQYNIELSGASNPLATEIPYRSFDDVEAIALATVNAINASGLNIVAVNLGGGRISLGDIAEDQFGFPADPVPINPGDPIVPVVRAPLTVRRGIVDDGEQIIITQGNQTLRFEFEAATGGGGVAPGFIPVVFQPGSSVDNVASVLAAAINNNRGNLTLNATAISGGRVDLADNSQTVVDVSNAPTVSLSGTPGGANPIRFNGSFGSEEMKLALIAAINAANAEGTTSLTAVNRGGGTFFIENAQFIDGPLDNYFLQAVKDIAGNPLKPNREDNTTQFTLLLPTVGLDYGDAPDPFQGVAGRYPTLLVNDGARHVVDRDGVYLGNLIDVDNDGMPSPTGNGDDTTIFVVGTTGTLFNAVVQPGFVEISFNLGGPISAFDGNTVTISTGVDTATLEFDTNGLFNENNFAVSVDGSTTVTAAMIAAALKQAVDESPLRPADVVVVGNTVRIITDDEDGVVFTSAANPGGIINPGVPLVIEVTVTGSGVLEAWIDFNFDGDWDDPNEQIITAATPGAIFSSAPGVAVTRSFVIPIPATAPRPNVPTQTFARFRVSADGGLRPTGLALSGEVEDYALTILPGAPPVVTPANRELEYRVDEDGILQARDFDGTLTPNITNDNSILVGIVDPDGDMIGVFADDIGTRTLLDPSGEVAGELTLLGDGTFSFVPAADFFGSTSFTARVTDLKTTAPGTQLLSPIALTVNITVDPVNDRPVATTTPAQVRRSTSEDVAITLTLADLTSFFSPGPANESGQPLSIQSAGVNGVGFQTELGGVVQLVDGNIRYTPPANFPGPGPDRFTYIVADDPQDPNQFVETAAVRGTVLIDIASVNDAPIVTNDSFTFSGDGPFTIPITGVGGILTNDLPGPPDEVAAGQTISLVAGQFPKGTLRGGLVNFSSDGLRLVYTPPANFSGPDQFEYQVVDTGTPAATSTGTVLINVDGDNSPPIFIGINGDTNRRSLQYNESKQTEQVFDFNLNSWFFDPEGDASTFTVSSSNSGLVNATLIVDPATGATTLRLRLPSYQFGNATLTIVATNVGGGPAAPPIEVPVTVINTPDAPVLIGTLNPLRAQEDETIVRNLANVFFDPDGGQLVYSVTRIGNIINPTPAQIAASGLVQSVVFSGNQMTINLVPNASGSAQLEITASDGTFSTTDSFTLNVSSEPDSPVGNADVYQVPIGGRLQVLNPAQGVLANDTDADSDVFPGTNQKLRVQLSSVTQPSRGTLTMNADGTFIYNNTSGRTGDVDTFTYRPIDPTGLLGNLVTVSLQIGQSSYQNPLEGFQFDVTADGNITPLDALRILNLLASRRTASVPVSSLTAPPPDFYDVNGDGRIEPVDALEVIMEISRRNRLRLGEGEAVSVAIASTSQVYAASSISLPEIARQEDESEAAVYTVIADPMNDWFGEDDDDHTDLLADDVTTRRTQSSDGNIMNEAIDEALLSWIDATNL